MLSGIFGDEEEQDYLEDSTENEESAPGDDFEDDFEDDFGDFGDVEVPVYALCYKPYNNH